MRPLNENIIPLQTAATVTSAAVHSLNLLYISAQITCTGAAAGTLQLQASNDAPTGNVGPVNFNNITGASVTVTGAGSYLIPIQNLCYEYIRFVYTNTGTGTINVVFKALGE